MSLLLAAWYLILTSVVVLLSQRTWMLYINYGIARKMGLPIIILPVGWQDDLWLASYPLFTWLKRIPFVDRWFDYTRFSWTQDHRFRPHRQYGDGFLIVTPGGVELMFNDPHSAFEIHSKYRQWPKPEPVFAMLDTFGRHVVSVNGDDWQRHRRIVNPAFQEQTNKVVWNEARLQAHQMLDGWVKNNNSALIENVSTDCVVIALHVLSAAGFGQRQDFDSGFRDVPFGHKKSFADTMSFLLTHLVLVSIFHQINLPDWMLPQVLRDVKWSVADFKLYMQETVAYTKGLIHGGNANQSADMVTALIKANEAAKSAQQSSGPQTKPIFLTDNEVLGNLFILNVAGFETTANALSYTIPYLAMNPDVQEWLREEVDPIWKGKGDASDLEYEKTFPKLTRCLAAMYETLRLWGPVTDTSRWGADETQVLKVGGQEVVVPKGVYVSANNYGVLSDPRWWGEDSLEWKPERWITVDAETKQEKIRSPPSGAEFIAWAAGPRVCPGKKFSQVEFTAVLSVLIAKYKLEPLVMADKGMKAQQDGSKAISDAIWASYAMITPKIGNRKEAGVAIFAR